MIDLGDVIQKLTPFLAGLPGKNTCLMMFMILLGAAHCTDPKTGIGSAGRPSDAEF